MVNILKKQRTCNRFALGCQTLYISLRLLILWTQKHSLSFSFNQYWDLNSNNDGDWLWRQNQATVTIIDTVLSISLLHKHILNNIKPIKTKYCYIPLRSLISDTQSEAWYWFGAVICLVVNVAFNFFNLQTLPATADHPFSHSTVRGFFILIMARVCVCFLLNVCLMCHIQTFHIFFKFDRRSFHQRWTSKYYTWTK